MSNKIHVSQIDTGILPGKIPVYENTGALKLIIDPVDDLDATPKQYVDNKVQTVNALIKQYITDLDTIPKQYVDTQLTMVTDTIKQYVVELDTTSKQYINQQVTALDSSLKQYIAELDIAPKQYISRQLTVITDPIRQYIAELDIVPKQYIDKQLLLLDDSIMQHIDELDIVIKQYIENKLTEITEYADTKVATLADIITQQIVESKQVTTPSLTKQQIISNVNIKVGEFFITAVIDKEKFEQALDYTANEYNMLEHYPLIQLEATFNNITANKAAQSIIDKHKKWLLVITQVEYLRLSICKEITKNDDLEYLANILHNFIDAVDKLSGLL